MQQILRSSYYILITLMASLWWIWQEKWCQDFTWLCIPVITVNRESLWWVNIFYLSVSWHSIISFRIVQVAPAVVNISEHYEERNSIYTAYMEEAEGGDSEELDPEATISCIGKRKRCLLDRQCREMLTDFRLHCRENKKKNQCVSTHPWVIFENLGRQQ